MSSETESQDVDACAAEVVDRIVTHCIKRGADITRDNARLVHNEAWNIVCDTRLDIVAQIIDSYDWEQTEYQDVITARVSKSTGTDSDDDDGTPTVLRSAAEYAVAQVAFRKLDGIRPDGTEQARPDRFDESSSPQTDV